MTLEANTYPRRVTLTSGAQAISIDYFLFNDEVKMTVFPVSGAASYVGTEGVDYSLTGAGNEAGGTLTTIGLAVGDIVAVERDMEFYQETNLPTAGKFNESDIEQALDELTMQTQQVKGLFDRSMKLPLEETPTDALTEFPSLASRKSKALGFNASGEMAPLALGTSTDADGVNYTHGATGSVARTVESRLQDFVSVEDFGAVGDGSTDDTAAIQAAIDWAESQKPDRGGTIRLGPKRYATTAPLVIDGEGVTIQGPGTRFFSVSTTSSIIASHTTGPVIHIKASSTRLKGFRIDSSGSRLPTNAYTRRLTGTAASGTTSTIVLASGASTTDDYYNGDTVWITHGTGVGQIATITDYVGSTLTATAVFKTAPDATSKYSIGGTTSHDFTGPAMGSTTARNDGIHMVATGNGATAAARIKYCTIEDMHVRGQPGCGLVLTGSGTGTHIRNSVFEFNNSHNVYIGSGQELGVRALGSVTLDSGASGSVDDITVNSVSILPSAVSFDTSLTQTAKDVVNAINDSITSPAYKAEFSGTATINIYAGAVGTAENGFVVSSSTTTIGSTDVNMAGGVDGYTHTASNRMGIGSLEHCRTNDCGGQNVLIGDMISGSVDVPYRWRVINHESYRSGMYPRNLHHDIDSDIVILGENIEYTNSATQGRAGGRARFGNGVYFGGRCGHFTNNRFIDCYEPLRIAATGIANGSTAIALGLGTKHVTVSGSVVSNTDTTPPMAVYVDNIQDFPSISSPPDDIRILNIYTGDVTDPYQIDQEIVGGVIDCIGTYHIVETENSDPSDDLDNIRGGVTGQVVTLSQLTTNTVTVRHNGGGGNIRLAGSVSFVFGGTQDKLTLMFDGTRWIETSRTVI